MDNNNIWRPIPGVIALTNKNGVVAVRVPGGLRLLQRVRKECPGTYIVRTTTGRKIRLRGDEAVRRAWGESEDPPHD